MDLQIREKEIFETLKKLKDLDFVIIGGYSVNAYTLPRFSIDCDIVVKNEKELEKIEEVLTSLDFCESMNKSEVPYDGKFKRLEKEIQKGYSVSLDILIKEVLDRQTGAIFSADWIFENSSVRALRGKTIIEELKLRIINPDALFIMKIISCRSTDIRDIFLLVSNIEDREKIKEEINKRRDFKDRLEKVKREIKSKQFKDGLQGVFGFVDDKIFNRNKKMIEDL
jgi:hypothetical protein